jgi:HPt (histidine-containing phosphotransfer) domain-containing protein
MADFDTIDKIQTYLEDEFAMDQEEIDEMVEILLESIQEQIAELKTAIQSGNTEDISKIGHAVKGAASNIGAVYISEIGKNFENPEINSDSGKCTEEVEKLQEAINLLKN